MATMLKCKICGGDLDSLGIDVAVCQYCGTKQILPKMTSERKANLYDRADHYRSINEFDKAFAVYEQVLAEDDADAEVYWDLVLCRYGIEYVEDPRTRKRIPTVNRTQFQSIYEDRNYIAAVEHASKEQKDVIEADAELIDRIQKGILDISSKEQPYDIFICYKETDNSGRRTPDSVLAQDIYKALTEEGYKVFFSRITLEDKLGSAYEPYIFAALNSSKVMIAVGTKPEYFNAVWVKNEWSRYLGLINAGEKKVLIPAYKDMDPYDLPEEFSHLQAIDMGKLGSIQDLTHAISKIIGSVSNAVTTGNAIDISAYKNRIEDFLENADYDKAIEYCDKVLDISPKDPVVHSLKLCAEVGVKNIQELKNVKKSFTGLSAYKNAIKYGKEQDVRIIEECAEVAQKTEIKRNSQLKKRIIGGIIAITGSCVIALFVFLFAIPYNKYTTASRLLDAQDYDAAIAVWAEIESFGDSRDRIREAYGIKYKDIEELITNHEYDSAEEKITNVADNSQYSKDKINELEEYMLETKYNQGLELLEQGDYDDAIAVFSNISGYMDSDAQIIECKYCNACALYDEGTYYTAKLEFEKLDGYKDSEEKIELCNAELLHLNDHYKRNVYVVKP